MQTNARRTLLAALGAAALAAAFPALAQPKPFRVAWASPTKAADGSPFLEELRRGLRELGYVEGRSIVIEAYWGEDSPDRIGAMVAEAVASRPDVIVAQGASAPPMRRATSSIPVVFGYSGDPVAAGLVQSLSRPGGNLTGISFLALDLVGKRIELVKEVLPSAKRLAVVAQPQHQATRESGAPLRRLPPSRRAAAMRWYCSRCRTSSSTASASPPGR